MNDSGCVVDDASQHAHLHVIPRFDDEPLADRGGRSAIKRTTSPPTRRWRQEFVSAEDGQNLSPPNG